MRPSLTDARCAGPPGRWLALVLLIGIPIISGCTEFRETYYVGVLRQDTTQPLQFYRFTLRGRADWGTKTEFVSGWYPAEALQAVVGEYRNPRDPKELFESSPKPPPKTTTQPCDKQKPENADAKDKLTHTLRGEITLAVPGKVTLAVEATAEPADPDPPEDGSSGLEYYVIGPEGLRKVLADQRLVIFMSSDPGPVTSAIQAFARSQDVQKSVAQMVRGLRKQETKKKQGYRKRLASIGLRGLKTHVAGLEDGSPVPTEVVSQILGELENLLNQDAAAKQGEMP